MPDPIFADQRLADVYDAFDDDRRDLEAYVALVAELGARSVLDIGCGTGTFGCELARLGVDVVGVDPAVASLDVARRKPPAERVQWIVGDATALPPLQVDLVTMTGNVAQVFTTDDDWASALRAARAALRPGGTLVFETRDPAREAWHGWVPDRTRRTVEVPGIGAVEAWCDLIEVAPPLVSFRWTFVFGADGAVLTSDSVLRFRGREELGESLDASGFEVREFRDAPDRPGLELVVIATAR
jgi:SAM-dependent methyltransferase